MDDDSAKDIEDGHNRLTISDIEIRLEDEDDSKCRKVPLIVKWITKGGMKILITPQILNLRRQFTAFDGSKIHDTCRLSTIRNH